MDFLRFICKTRKLKTHQWDSLESSTDIKLYVEYQTPKKKKKSVNNNINLDNLKREKLMTCISKLQIVYQNKSLNKIKNIGGREIL